MARYFVEEETGRGEPSGSRVAFEGLAVAKASARKRAQKSSRPVVVRDADTGETVARFAASRDKDGAVEETPALASSVQRMRAANDRLKEALGSGGANARKKRAR